MISEKKNAMTIPIGYMTIDDYFIIAEMNRLDKEEKENAAICKPELLFSEPILTESNDVPTACSAAV